MTVKKFIKKAQINNNDCIRLLKEWLTDAENGDVATICIVGKRVGGEWSTSMSASNNSLEDAGMLIEIGLRRLGFALSS